VPTLITPVVTFAIYTAIAAEKGTTLDASRLFTSLSLLILLSEPLFYTFNGVIDLMSAMGCFDRIQAFLLKESRSDKRDILELSTNKSNNSALGRGLDKDNMAIEENKPGPGIEPRVVLRDASFGWEKAGEPTVKGVNMTVLRGELAIIVGSVASGKSTLLKGLIGETPLSSGVVQLHGSHISWCQQSAWLTVSVKKSARLSIAKTAIECIHKKQYHRLFTFPS
jgi:ATP-binding cassette subfamily C (CFTR/MRP) protein 1